MNLEAVVTITARLQSWAVIGAWALAARGYVRQTSDFDLMTTDRTALDEATWTDLSSGGYRIEVRRGDHEDPLAGVVRIQWRDFPIDLVVAKYKWQQAIIDRAETMTIETVALRVPRAADLILLKLFAGGHGDLHDIGRLLVIGPREELIAEVDAALGELPDEMRIRWAGLLLL